MQLLHDLLRCQPANRTDSLALSRPPHVRSGLVAPTRMLPPLTVQCASSPSMGAGHVDWPPSTSYKTSWNASRCSDTSAERMV
jgi:hypothetical protein